MIIYINSYLFYIISKIKKQINRKQAYIHTGMLRLKHCCALGSVLTAFTNSRTRHCSYAVEFRYEI